MTVLASSVPETRSSRDPLFVLIALHGVLLEGISSTHGPCSSETVPSSAHRAFLRRLRPRVTYPTQSQPSPLAGPPAQTLISPSVAVLGSSDFNTAMNTRVTLSHTATFFFFGNRCDLGDLTQDTRLQAGIYDEGPEGNLASRMKSSIHCRHLRRLHRGSRHARLWTLRDFFP